MHCSLGQTPFFFSFLFCAGITQREIESVCQIGKGAMNYSHCVGGNYMSAAGELNGIDSAWQVSVALGVFGPVTAWHYNGTPPRPLTTRGRGNTELSEVHILKHFSTTHALIQKALDKVIWVFKDVLRILVTDEQGFYITNRRNALENPCNHSCSLRTLIQKGCRQSYMSFQGCFNGCSDRWRRFLHY